MVPNEGNRNYQIRYAVLDPDIIFNECGPKSAGPTGWDKKSQAEQIKAADKWIETLNKKNLFYDKLEKSMLSEGFRNPILVRAGWCPPRKLRRLPTYMQLDHSKILMCDANGGSRLWFAQIHKIPVPCIISDFCQVFADKKLLETEHQIKAYYKDEPQIIEFIQGQGVRIRGLPQTHIG